MKSNYEIPQQNKQTNKQNQVTVAPQTALNNM